MEMGDPQQTMTLPPVMKPAALSVAAPLKTQAALGYRQLSPSPDQPQHEREESKKDAFTDSTKLEKDTSNGNCNFQDGAHAAIAEFSSSENGYSATYKLDVTVLNCQVIAIDVPKLGWLDADHFKAADIDQSGDASFEDDKGRTFYIHIMNNGARR